MPKPTDEAADEQLTLDDFAFSPEEEQSAAEKFEVFHTENPRVYTLLVVLARQWVATTGRHKIGIGALTERVRWEIAITTNDPDFKINNNFRAYYARLIMRNEADLADIFDLRRSAADGWAGAA